MKTSKRQAPRPIGWYGGRPSPAKIETATTNAIRYEWVPCHWDSRRPFRLVECAAQPRLSGSNEWPNFRCPFKGHGAYHLKATLAWEK